MDEHEELQSKRNNYFKGSVNYGKVVTGLISITSRAWEIFKSSRIERKQQILGMIASNFVVDDKNLMVTLKSPFNTIYELNQSGNWGGWWWQVRTFLNLETSFNNPHP